VSEVEIAKDAGLCFGAGVSRDHTATNLRLRIAFKARSGSRVHDWLNRIHYASWKELDFN
jgi:hypothetical protein